MQLRTPRDIGLAIRERRLQSKLDQDQLAKQVGVSRKWVIDVEKGKPGAEMGLILRVFLALGLRLTVGENSSLGNVEAHDIDDVINRARDQS